ncbi:PucR family transcriptional regulator [Kitasatospora sp. MMS16-BH015]|uniref:helix-turn-helix domain-containing protein n=1 Tax=Kitasatospora sp. MMS16-BH015 TaxID=2018025 RepID=UPI000CA30F0F|nr:helix-turn-helix domain-containing protein [Kitasatospora sp. MMS16-BH015]AUG76174.1 PucR family transcriptional regulator [Kitasatospora sp. MMS16-BH015]
MPTLGWLVTTVPELRVEAGPVGWQTRPVLGVVDHGEEGSVPAGHLMLLSGEPVAAGSAARVRQAAAVVAPAGTAPGRLGVPVLRATPELSWLRVARVIAEERLREARERTALLEQLLAQAREPAAQGVERVVEWLGRTLGAHVLLDGAGLGNADGGSPPDGLGTPVASSPRAEAALAAAGRATVADPVAAGRLRTAVLAGGGLHLRLAAVGRAGAYLTVGRVKPFGPSAGGLVAQAAGLLDPLLRLRAAEGERERAAELASGLRVAVFQLLMGGEVTLAQRAAEGLVPGLLAAESVRVQVLECPAEERNALADACAEATAGRALVVRCPATEQHLIVVSPVEGPEPAADAGWGTAGRVLRGFLAGHPERRLGGSGVHPLEKVAAAYGDAIRALAAARLRPGRAALYAVEDRLVRVLDRAVAREWAAGVLAPLHAVPLAGRDQLYGTLGLGLEFPATSAGRILGVSRNTVRARMDRAAALLGLDLSRVAARAVLHLALRVGESESGTGASAVRLAEVLGAEAARAWAEGLAERLAEDGRDLRGTLRAWLGADANVERAARRLGLHPQTVREHLRSAEQLLQRQLLSGGSGVYETALAFAALGELELHLEPGRAGRAPEGAAGTVHS